MARELSGATILATDIVALAHDGRGIGRIDGKAVFVAGALPGEHVRVRVTKRRRRMDEAELVEVLTASPHRVLPKCAHFGLCGGCSLQHLAPAAQLALKQTQLLDDLERIGRVQPERVLAPLEGPSWGYRRRARLGVKYVHKKGRVLAGFRERDKPYLADIHRCEVLVDEFATLPEELAALVATLTIRERIPQVEIAVGDTAAALVFRVLAPPPPEDAAKLDAFGARRGVEIHLQSGGIDTIRPLRPGPALRYTIDGAGVVIEFGPLDFIQVNRAINAGMVNLAAEQLECDAGDRLLDLFCGTGNLTLPLARRAQGAVGVEGDAGLVEKARANALHNGIGNARFHVDNLFAPAGLGAWASQRYDRVMLDPPRAGARELMELMPRWRPRRIVYISCHSGTLARDAGLLVASQGFRLITAGVMDMFPHTNHIESIAVFENRT